MITNRLIAIGSRNQLSKEKPMYKTALNGKIVDLKGKGVPFASIGLFDENVLLGGSISNETGNYQLAFNFLPNYTYRLKITSVGFKSKEIDFTYPDTLAAKQIVLGDDQSPDNVGARCGECEQARDEQWGHYASFILNAESS